MPGKASIIKKGTDVLFISCGSILKETLQAIDILSSDFDCGLINVHSLKPLDIDSLIDQFSIVDFIVTVEEHSIIGGIGSAVSEVIAQCQHNSQLLMIGIPDVIVTQIGKRDYLLKHYNMDAKSIANRVSSLMSM